MRIFHSTLAKLVRQRDTAFSTRLTSSCPFQVLGLQKTGTSYVEVQAAFRKLAKLYHPDISGCSSSTSLFVRVKDAFHSIVEGPRGIAVLRNDHFCDEQNKNDENKFDLKNKGNECELNAFPQEGHDIHDGLIHPSINPQVIYEIADVADEMNPGGLDRGGMWQYANMIKSLREKNGGDGLPPLRVEGGDNAVKPDIDSTIKRRRRRK